MELTFLGTGSAMPTRRRNVAAVALRLLARREIWLFDCGEATQHQLLRVPLRPPQIRRIFITHLHGDHVYGLPGLLTSLSMLGVESSVTVHAPTGIAELVEPALRVAHAACSFPLVLEELAPGPVLDDGALRVHCLPLDHGVPCFGFRVEERPRPGRFDPARAAALGVPRGPAFAALKNGSAVSLADGRVVRGEEVTAPPVPGRVLAILGDSRPCDAAVELARDADLLVHEATFGDAHAAMADARGHSTATQAAQVARRAGARALVLTHFSARYQEGSDVTVDDLLAEARREFPATEAAHDLLAVTVPPSSAAGPTE